MKQLIERIKLKSYFSKNELAVEMTDNSKEVRISISEVQPFVIKINELDDLIDALNKIGE